MKKANERLEVTEALNLWGDKYAPSHIDLENIKVMKRVGEAAHFLHERNRLTLVNLIEAVRILDVQGLLAHKSSGPTLVIKEVPVPVEKKLSKPDRLQQAGLGATADKFVRTEFDRIEQAKPRASEAQLQAQAETDLAVNVIMNDVLSTIRQHGGATHAATESQRNELMSIFNKFKTEVTDVASAEKMQRTIKAKIDSYDSNNAGWGRVKAPSLR